MNAFIEERSGFEQLWLLGGGHFKYFSFSNELGQYIPNGVKDEHTDQELVYALVTLNTAYVFYMGGFKKGRGKLVPEGSVLVEKKNTEDWYLDDDECLWLDHDGIDGTLCELSIGEVKPVQHKEYLITQSNTLYAARVWDDNDVHIAWKLFDSQETALDAANHCKQMYEASESGVRQ